MINRIGVPFGTPILFKTMDLYFVLFHYSFLLKKSKKMLLN